MNKLDRNTLHELRWQVGKAALNVLKDEKSLPSADYVKGFDAAMQMLYRLLVRMLKDAV